MVDCVEVVIYRGDEEVGRYTLNDVIRGVPALFEALETLTEWLPYNWVVRALFLSKRSVQEMEEEGDED